MRKTGGDSNVELELLRKLHPLAGNVVHSIGNYAKVDAAIANIAQRFREKASDPTVDELGQRKLEDGADTLERIGTVLHAILTGNAHEVSDATASLFSTDEFRAQNVTDINPVLAAELALAKPKAALATTDQVLRTAYRVAGSDEGLRQQMDALQEFYVEAKAAANRVHFPDGRAGFN